jgi:hypothetical protein
MNLLTVGIISYNRPFELERTIKSLLPLPDNVEVVICDDNSPKIDEILIHVKDHIKDSNINFVSNSVNLGYDRNLYKVIQLANSEFVLLLGDDDYLETGALQNIINFLKNHKDLKCGFIKYTDEFATSRSFNSNVYFDKTTLMKNGDFVYNSILFSGLIFSKQHVVLYENIFEKFFHSIYIQVAIFCFLNAKYGSYFIHGPGIIIGGDGENGFGFNEASSKADIDLMDRTKSISNLSYHKRLFNVLLNIEYEINSKFFDKFIFEYKIRAIKALFNARKISRDYLRLYWVGLKKLGIKKIWLIEPIYLFFYIIPYNILAIFILFFESLFLKYRNYKNNKTI